MANLERRRFSAAVDRDGQELFYIAPDGALMAVAVSPGLPEFGRPHELFDTGLHLHSYSIWMNQYSVANDGQTFLLNRFAEGSPPALVRSGLAPRGGAIVRTRFEPALTRHRSSGA
jgi:hypothetical protein